MFKKKIQKIMVSNTQPCVKHSTLTVSYLYRAEFSENMSEHHNEHNEVLYVNFTVL